MMLKKIIAGILCAAALLSGTVLAAPQGAVLDPAEEIIFPVPDVRILFADAANINGRKMIYGKAGNNNVYAYDATDPANIREVSMAKTSGSDKGVVIYDNYLIYATNQKLEVRAIESDGSLGGEVLSYIEPKIGTIERVKRVDDFLFVTGNQLVCYDLRDTAGGNIVKIGMVDAGKSRDFVVQASGDIYRVYMIQAKDLEQKYPKDEKDKLQTLYLKICDVDVGAWSVQEQYNGIPITDVWPGYGRYGEEDTGEGYLGFSEGNNGSLNAVGDGILRVTMGSGANTGIPNDDFVVDATDPAAPTVILFEEQERDSCAPFQADLGNGVYALVRQYNSNNGKIARDYSNPQKPRTLYTLGSAGGDCVVVLDNMLYVFINGKIASIKLYEEYTITAFKLDKGQDAATAVFTLDNNVPSAQQFMLIAAAYMDGKMTGISYVPCTAEGFAKDASFTAEVPMPEGSTVKAWVIDSFKNMDILTDILN